MKDLAGHLSENFGGLKMLSSAVLIPSEIVSYISGYQDKIAQFVKTKIPVNQSHYL